MTRRPLTFMLAALLLTASIHAQQPVFTVNGQTNATVALGADTEFRVVSNPGALVNILLNIDDGPSDFLGMPMPVAVDQNLILSHIGVPVDANGLFVDLLSIPVIPELEGFTLFGVCITNDATLPTTFGLSNGVSLVFSRRPEAGADTAGLVGEAITLDGTLNIATPLQPGQELAWNIVAGPNGHGATLSGADTALPTFTADVAGTYTVRLEIVQPGTTGGSFDDITVEVHELDVTSHAHGDFDTSDPVNVAANINGPAGGTLTAPGLSGTATSVSGNLPAGFPFTRVPFTVTSSNGQISGRELTLINNVGAPMGTAPLDSVGVELRQPLLTAVETALETAVGLIDLSGPIMGIPAIPVLNIPGPFGTTLFSADVTPTGFAYDPNIDIALTFDPGATHVQATINNVVLMFDVSGLIFSVPYTDQGMLSMTSLVLEFDVTTTAGGGAFVSTSSNETASINGAALTFTGGAIPNNFASQLLTAVLPVFEGLAAQLLPPLVIPAIDTLFAALPQQIDLAPGADMTLDFTPGSTVHSLGGFTLLFDGGATATIPDPTAPQPTAYFGTPSSPPVFGATVPGSTQGYDLAFALSDDFLNQTLATLLQVGALNQSLTGPLDILGTPVNSDAGSFALIFPGLGFERLDPATPVVIAVSPGIAPVVEITSTGMDQLTLHVADLVVDLRAEVAPGYSASIARIGLGGSAGLNVAVNPMTNTLDITAGSVMSDALALATLPGVDATPLLPSLTALLDLALPGLLSGFGSIPIPDLGLGLPITPVAIIADGPSGDYLTLYLD